MQYSQLHTVHPFPARMASDLAFDELAVHAREGRTLLDPMCGSGTALAAGLTLGMNVVGLDTDPLALRISSAWCIGGEDQHTRDAANRVLSEARRSWDTVPGNDSYPPGASAATREFLDYWFDSESRKKLRSLADGICLIRSPRIRTILWVVFSGIVIVKESGASLAMDVAHSRPHRVYRTAPRDVFVLFERRLELVCRGMLYRSMPNVGSRARIRMGDARNFRLRDPVDVVLTSPPYLNAIDYLRGHKFSLVWMGHQIESLQTLRSTNIGSEVGMKSTDKRVDRVLARQPGLETLPARWTNILRRYTQDLFRVCTRIHKALKPGGIAIWVIGDNCVRGVPVSNSQILEACSLFNDFEIKEVRQRLLSSQHRYLPPPCSSPQMPMERRMNSETVLIAQKRSS